MPRTILTTGIAILAAVLSVHAPAFAQETAQPMVCFRAFDEYGQLRHCDHLARLDNYAIQLMNQPEFSGYIVVYAPPSANKQIRDSITDYLVNTRGITAKRLKTIDAGYNTELAEPRIQLFLAPKDFKFDFIEKLDVNLQDFKGMLDAYQHGDDVAISSNTVSDEEESDVPSFGNVAFAAFDEILKAQKNATGYILGFNGADAAPGAWQRVGQLTFEALKEFGLEPGRLKIAYGGQSKETQVQLWIMPKGETPPIKDAASEPAPSTAVQIGDFDAVDLGNSKNESAVFNRLLTILRENSRLRACLIVRMEAEAPDDTEEPADAFKLVDKWKNDLTSKHQIVPDRVVLLYSKAEEGRRASVEVWVVPRGQPLPNPEDEQPSNVIKDTQRRP